MDNNTTKKTYTHQHDNGLQIQFNLDYSSVEEIKTGFKFKLNRPYSRQNNDISLEYITLDELGNHERRTIDEQLYYYRTEKYSGGSGGDEYILKIWKPINEKAIFLTYYCQAEIQPDYDPIWNIIENATILDNGLSHKSNP